MVGVNGVFRTRLIGVLHVAPSLENKQKKRIKSFAELSHLFCLLPWLFVALVVSQLFTLFFFLGRAIQHLKKRRGKKRKKSTFFVVYDRLSIFAEVDLCPVVRNKT